MEIEDKYVKRFWSKVDIKSEDMCWNLAAGKNSDGYGIYFMNKKHIKAHRFSWLIHFGKIPISKLVLHKCDNPSCVNPLHLLIGTHKDNTVDMIRKGRSKLLSLNRINRECSWFCRGEDIGRAILVDSQVRYIRKLYESGSLTQLELSLDFDISENQISRIVNYKNWKHI